MLSDSSSLQSVTRLPKRTRTNAVADTLINDNNYHLDSYSHLRFDRLIGSLKEPINTITFHVKQLGQEQRQEIKRMGLLSNLHTIQVFVAKLILFTYPNYIADGFCYVRTKVNSFIVILLTFHRFYALPNIAGFMPKNDNDWQWIPPAIQFGSLRSPHLKQNSCQKRYNLQSFH